MVNKRSLIVVIKILFDIMYLYGIRTVWSDSRLFLHQHYIRYFVSWIVFFLFVYLLKEYFGDKRDFQQCKISHFIIGVLSVFSLLPSICMYGAGSFSDHFFAFLCYYWLILLILLNYGKRFENLILKSCFIDANKKYIFYLLFVICAISTIYAMIHYDISFIGYSMFSPEIYEQRAYFASLAKPKWLNYVLANASMVFLICMGFFFTKKKWKIAIIALVLQYMLYSLDGSKAVLAGGVIFCIAYFLFPYLSWFRCFLLLSGATIISLIAVGISTKIGVYLTSYIYRRFMALPAFLGSCYFDFFNSHAPIRLFWQSNYPKLPFVIAEKYFDSPAMAANNGMLGEAAAMWGTWGCVIQPVIIWLFLEVANRATEGASKRVSFAVVAALITTLINSFLKTSLLSHGILVFLIMMFLWPNGEKDSEAERRNV